MARKTDLPDVNEAYEALLASPPKHLKGARVRRKAKGKKQFELVVKRADPAVANLDPGRHALTVAGLIMEGIANNLDSAKLPTRAITRQRRSNYRNPGSVADRALIKKRYPGKYQADPQGYYGVDSGFLRDQLTKNLKLVRKGDKADVFAGIPRIRQKAAFVIRDVDPDTGKLSAGAKVLLAKATTRLSNEILIADIRKLEKAKRLNAQLKAARGKAIFDLARTILGGL